MKNLAKRSLEKAAVLYLDGLAGQRKLNKLLPAVSPIVLETTWDNILVLAPHPDDEVFGAGLLLNKLRGKKITIAFATSGEAYSTGTGGNRRREAEASAQGFQAEAVFLDLRDGHLGEISDLSDRIVDLCSKIHPEAVVLPWFGDYHPDHRALARAAVKRPHPAAQYLFYSTFSPLWPQDPFVMGYVAGEEAVIREALDKYLGSVNQDTVNGYCILRRALARRYLGDGFWEPMLTISGAALAEYGNLPAQWPAIYPTLSKARHLPKFLEDLEKLHQAIGETK